MKTDRILIPLDGSALAESAIATAVEMARPGPATLVLVRAAEAHTFPGADPTEAQVRVVQEAETYLAGVTERLKKEGLANVETSVWYGSPAAAIVDAARARKADVIVMSTHGRSGLGRVILGSVAEAVLRGTTTPILLLRAAQAPIETPKGTGEARPAKEKSNV